MMTMSPALRDQELFDVSAEAGVVDRRVDDAGGAIRSQRKAAIKSLPRRRPGSMMGSVREVLQKPLKPMVMVCG
jgi:hypothetical protein